IDGDLGQDLPLILQVNTGKNVVDVAVVADREYAAGGHACVVDLVDQRGGVSHHIFVQRGETGANGVLVVDLVAEICLDAAGVERPLHVAGNAVEEEIADLVRHEVDAAVAAKRGDLQVQLVHRFLIGNHAVI